MPNTMTLIASSTVGSGGAASIDFTSIPSTYTDLVLKISARGSDNTGNFATILFTLNSSTSSFTNKILFGTGTGGTGSSTATRAVSPANAALSTASTFTNSEIYIPNYAGSSYKSYSADSIAEDNAGGARDYLYAGLWSNTAAITSVSISFDAGNFVQFSSAYLYGVKNA